MRNLRFAFCLSVLACHIASAQQAPAVVPAIARAGLEAQVAGACWPGVVVREDSVRFFPGVRFFRGTCPAEHVGTHSALDAIDSDGVLYLLDSRSAFSLLLNRHPPVGIDSSSVLSYAWFAAVMTGEVAPLSKIVRDPSVTIDSVGLSITKQTEPSRVIGSDAMLWHVSLTTVDDFSLKRSEVWVHRRPLGRTIILTTDLWRLVINP